jgi:Leucine-rich repeat (LRR) protein
MTSFTYTGTETIPEDTEVLNCNDNQLTSLPDLSTLTDLRELYCWCNQLTSLPDLSTLTNLQVLHCWDNQLTSLPDLPLNLQDLTCWDNQLTSLPNLSAFIYLQRLNCKNNQLTSLPDLPLNLQYLYCKNNPLPQECLQDDWLTLNKNTMYQKLKQEFKELENENKKLKGIIEEMKLVPGYGEYYQQAKANFENHTSGFNKN